MFSGSQLGSCWKQKLNEIGRVTLIHENSGASVVSFVSIKSADDKVYECAPENAATKLPLTINKSETFLCQIQNEGEFSI